MFALSGAFRHLHPSHLRGDDILLRLLLGFGKGIGRSMVKVGAIPGGVCVAGVEKKPAGSNRVEINSLELLGE